MIAECRMRLPAGRQGLGSKELKYSLNLPLDGGGEGGGE
jgi:hypothetical protein